MAILLICSHCSQRLRLQDDRAGTVLSCPTCGGVNNVPAATPTAPGPRPPAPSQPTGPSTPAARIPPRPPQLPPPLIHPPKPNPEPPPSIDDDEDFELEFLQKRRLQRLFGTVWKSLTLAWLAVTIICYFLPWVRYSIVFPLDPMLDFRLELATQSGFQVTFARLSWNPLFERLLLRELKISEADQRFIRTQFGGKWLQDPRFDMAPWLVLHPVSLLIAMLVVVIAQPTRTVCVTVGMLSLVAALLLLVQFAILEPPIVQALYDRLLADRDPSLTIVIAILFDVQYTMWFKLGIFGIVATLLTQIVGFGLARR